MPRILLCKLAVNHNVLRGDRTIRVKLYRYPAFVGTVILEVRRASLPSVTQNNTLVLWNREIKLISCVERPSTLKYDSVTLFRVGGLPILLCVLLRCREGGAPHVFCDGTAWRGLPQEHVCVDHVGTEADREI